MLPAQDDSISDETPLYRRINPAAPHVVPDEILGCQRISTGAFRDPDLSVAIGDTLTALGRDPASLLDGYPDYYLVAFPAAVARDSGLTLIRDATPDEPAHAVVRGKKRKPVMRALAAACVWVVQPDNACDPPYPEI